MSAKRSAKVTRWTAIDNHRFRSRRSAALNTTSQSQKPPCSANHSRIGFSGCFCSAIHCDVNRNEWLQPDSSTQVSTVSNSDSRSELEIGNAARACWRCCSLHCFFLSRSLACIRPHPFSPTFDMRGMTRVAGACPLEGRVGRHCHHSYTRISSGLPGRPRDLMRSMSAGFRSNHSPSSLCERK